MVDATEKPPSDKLVTRLRTVISDALARAKLAKNLNRPDLAKGEMDLASRVTKWLAERGIEA